MNASQNESRLVVFVCTGNICRSPMAEYLFRALLGPSSGWVVKSAGTSGFDGLPASEAAVAVLKEKGIDLSPHRSQPLTRDLIDAASLIVVMTTYHEAWIRRLVPQASGKVRLLRSFDGNAAEDEVSDPIGMGTDVYREIRDEINAALSGLAAYLRQLEAGKGKK
jgi:protein-tyrosine-phosphatase